MLYSANSEQNKDIFVFYWSMSPGHLWNLLLKKTLTLHSPSGFERKKRGGEEENLGIFEGHTLSGDGADKQTLCGIVKNRPQRAQSGIFTVLQGICIINYSFLSYQTPNSSFLSIRRKFHELQLFKRDKNSVRTFSF